MQEFWRRYKKKYSFLLILALLVFVPLFPKFPLLNVKGTYVAIRLEDILIGLTIILWFYSNLANFRKYLKQTIYQIFILFWLVGILSLISGFTLTHTIKPSLGILNFLRRIEVMSLFFVTASSIASFEQVRTIFKVMAVVTITVVLFGFGQQWLHFPVVTTNNSELSKGTITTLAPGSRVNSTFAGQYDLAAYLSIIIALLASIFFIYKKIRNRLYIAFIGLISFILLGLTESRISFVAAIMGTTVSFWLLGKRVFIVIILIVSIASILLIPGLRHRFVATVTVNLLNGGGPKYEVPQNLTYNTNSDWYRVSPASRAALLAKSLGTASVSASEAAKISVDIAPGEPINKTEQGVYRSFDIRTLVEWPRAIRAFAKNPILGTGYSSITLATDNDILRSFGETGLLGTLALTLIFVALFKKMVSTIKIKMGYERGIIIGMLSATVALLITSTVIDVLEASKIAELFWIFMGITWAVMTDFKYAKDN